MVMEPSGTQAELSGARMVMEPTGTQAELPGAQMVMEPTGAQAELSGAQAMVMEPSGALARFPVSRCQGVRRFGPVAEDAQTRFEDGVPEEPWGTLMWACLVQGWGAYLPEWRSTRNAGRSRLGCSSGRSACAPRLAYTSLF